MQKAGTGFLYDLLGAHPRVWMPPLKEIHHFTDTLAPAVGPEAARIAARRDAVSAKARRLSGVDAGARARIDARRSEAGQMPVSQTEAAFWAAYVAYRQAGRSDAAYRALFAPCPPGRLTGDITPAYSTLDPGQIVEVREALPRARVLIVIRDPVTRLWSQLNMRARGHVRKRRGRGLSTTDMLSEMRAFLDGPAGTRKLLQDPKVLSRAFPTRIHAAWTQGFGAGAVQTVVFEEMVQDPAGTLSRILAGLGLAKDAVTPDGFAAPENRKAQSAKLALDPATAALLADLFADEMQTARALFGPAVSRWRLFADADRAQRLEEPAPGAAPVIT